MSVSSFPPESESSVPPEASPPWVTLGLAVSLIGMLITFALVSGVGAGRDGCGAWSGNCLLRGYFALLISQALAALAFWRGVMRRAEGSAARALVMLLAVFASLIVFGLLALGRVFTD